MFEIKKVEEINWDPVKRSGGKNLGRPEVYPFSKLEVGEAFTVPSEMASKQAKSTFYNNVSERGRKLGRVFAGRILADGSRVVYRKK